MDTTALVRILFYVFTTVAAIFVIELLYLAIAGPIRRRRSINRRLGALAGNPAGEQVLHQLRAERGIPGEGLEALGWLRRLLVHSGLRMTAAKFLLLLVVLCGSLLAILNLALGFSTLISLAVAAVLGVAVPLQIVRIIRNKRQKKFAEQLPEALDVIVRGLRSGHPVSVAFSLVGRELQDPIGSEFGITIDEMTYGLDTTRALRNLGDRVGIPDMSLLVTAVSLQSTSGGNLSEVLSNLSKVLRDRFQLRRKVRALSAEGRFSAIGLAILPAAIFFAIFAQNPGYYFDVWDEPVFLPALGGLIVWSIIGNLIMRKMINFKY
jgi:tight adherence protein B